MTKKPRAKPDKPPPHPQAKDLPIAPLDFDFEDEPEPVGLSFTIPIGAPLGQPPIKPPIVPRPSDVPTGPYCFFEVVRTKRGLGYTIPFGAPK